MVLILMPLFALALGLFVFLKPALVIELQRRFYELINWRIEPISMERELRNTRFMGLFLVLASLTAAVYILFILS